MDEFDLIHSLLRPLASTEEALALQDDAALLVSRAGQQLVVTADMLQAGVHFFPDDPPEAIAQKALRVNLSDLAAMGAEAYGYFLSLGLPAGTDEAWLRRFCDGLAEDQRAYSIVLMGGDTTRTLGKLSLNITALGWVPKGQALRRNGARPGDLLYVSGTIGDGALGLHDAVSTAHARYLRPEPRLSLGVALRGVATAAMDVSDGLVQDAGHLAAASGVGLHIDAWRVPLSTVVQDAIAQGTFSLEQALTGGDDYELLFTAPPGLVMPDMAYCIGEVREGQGVFISDAVGKVLSFSRAGYRHRF
jgi:thiamine-monophosphate kinase